jgi:hypothetical protein
MAILSNPLTAAVIGVTSTTAIALLKGYIGGRPKTADEMRKLRLERYPVVWALTSVFSFWPRQHPREADLDAISDRLRNWYYASGGLTLSDNARARYGELQQLITLYRVRPNRHEDGATMVPTMPTTGYGTRVMPYEKP